MTDGDQDQGCWKPRTIACPGDGQDDDGEDYEFSRGFHAAILSDERYVRVCRSKPWRECLTPSFFV